VIPCSLKTALAARTRHRGQRRPPSHPATPLHTVLNILLYGCAMCMHGTAIPAGLVVLTAQVPPTTQVPRLQELDAMVLADDDYRRDDWVTMGPDQPPAAGLGPGPAAAASPSGPLLSGGGAAAFSVSSGAAQAASGTPGLDHAGSSSSNSSGGSSAGEHSSDDASSSAAEALDWTQRFPQLRAAIDDAVSCAR
jgi:hypothetical protein